MTKLLVDLPGMEKEFGLIAKMYAVADEFDVPLPPEELALYRTLLPSFSHLKVWKYCLIVVECTDNFAWCLIV